mgnify:FL=1
MFVFDSVYVFGGTWHVYQNAGSNEYMFASLVHGGAPQDLVRIFDQVNVLSGRVTRLSRESQLSDLLLRDVSSRSQVAQTTLVKIEHHRREMREALAEQERRRQQELLMEEEQRRRKR